MRSRGAAWLTIFVSLLVTAARPATAHEIGTTRVTVRFPADDAFRIEVVTDAQALMEKLAALQGKTPAARVDRRDFLALQQLFLGRVGIKFDADVARPAVDAVF